MRPKMVNGHVVLLPCFVFLWLRLSHAVDTLAAGSVMKDWEFLVSPNNVFKFGFFNPIFSGNRYLGIQYMNYSEQKIVWVSNRENPLTDSSGYLNITNDGNLVIHDQRGTSITVNSEKLATSSNISVKLLNSGNLVLKEGQQVVWQSFDHHTDTMLPGMKIGFVWSEAESTPNRVTHFMDRPRSSGSRSVHSCCRSKQYKTTYDLQRGVPYWRSGNRNGKNFTYFLLHDTESGKGLKFSHVTNEDESYFTNTLTDYNFSWIEMNSTGSIPIFLGQLDKGCYYEYGQKFGTMDEWTSSDNLSLGLND